MFAGLSRRSRSRFALAVGLFAAAAAPLAGAGPRDWNGGNDRGGQHDRDRDRNGGNRTVIDFDIIFGGGGGFRRGPVQRPPAHHHGPREHLPANLTYAAFQHGRTVILTVSGVNPAGAFTTRLDADRGIGGQVIVNMCNTTTADCTTPACNAFTVSGAIEVHRTLGCITLRVAGRSFEVPVQQVMALR